MRSIGVQMKTMAAPHGRRNRGTREPDGAADDWSSGEPNRGWGEGGRIGGLIVHALCMFERVCVSV